MYVQRDRERERDVHHILMDSPWDSQVSYSTDFPLGTPMDYPIGSPMDVPIDPLWKHPTDSYRHRY